MKKNHKLKLPRIGILGFGREGRSVLRYLKQSSQFKKSKIEILDKKSGGNYLKGLARFDVIFRSPGIPYNLPELKKAREDGVYFSSVTRLFFENYKGKIIGITGTKGKGTTSTLLYKILKAAGQKVFLAGNIGKSALDALLQNKNYPMAVLEFSSFQLHDLDISPEVAVMLDVFPDHQDAHTSLKEYYGAKANIGRFQKKKDRIFYFADNAMSKKLAMRSPAKKISVDYRKFKEGDLAIKGLHNFRNAVMAATVAASLGVDWATIKRVVKSYRGLEHRLEFTRKIGNVSFYDDSASTNPTTSAAAIQAFSDKRHETSKESVILIAGGQDKGLDYSPLRTALKKYRTEAVIIFGENKNKIRAAIKNLGVPIKLVTNLKTAVSAAYRICQNSTTYNLQPTTYAIIFSPGAASFDMFKDYADRGRKFKELVGKLK